MSETIVLSRLPLTKARVNLGAIVRRVHNNREQFILEKDGIPVAALLDVDEYEDYLDLKDPALKQQIREGQAEYRRGALKEDLDTFLNNLKKAPKKRAKR